MLLSKIEYYGVRNISMHKTVTNETLRHFTDGINLLIVSKSVKKINREVNYNFRLINNWLKANKLCLNSSKTEFFKAKTKQKLQNISISD